MSRSGELQLLLSQADGGPVLPGGLGGDATETAPEPAADPAPTYLWEEGGDPDDLAQQRWGVIAPVGAAGDRLLSRLAPLLAARQAEQGGHPIKIWRVPAQLDEAEAARWRKQHFDTGRMLYGETPRYVLIAGDLDQVSLPLQQVLAVDAFVGRLAFSDPQGYEAYVDKLLRSERPRPGRSLFYTVHDRTEATAIGHRSLIAPGAELMREARALGQLTASAVTCAGDRLAPSPSELLTLAASPEPTVLLSLSHGEGPPRGGWRGDDRRRQGQGAMSFGREGRLSGAELLGRRFLPQGLWLMVACYGAGTPDVSAYYPWLAELSALGEFRGAAESVLGGLPRGDERPFVAALPQAVLASPEGPLGFIGHMDLAWTYSFADLDSGPEAVPRPARFVAALRSALRGDRLGIACRELLRTLGQAQTELAALYMQSALTGTAPDETMLARRGHLWMLRQDLMGYVLLGDPAARLPVARPSAAETTSGEHDASEELTDVLGLSSSEPLRLRSTAQSTSISPSPSLWPSIAIERLEEAIGHALIIGRVTAELARACGLARDDLERRVERYRRGGRAALSEPDDF